MTPGALGGQLVAITGGSRGIGLQIAEWAAEAGANVAICSRRETDAQLAAAELTGRHGIVATGDACDVAEPGAVDAWVSRIVERFGRIDVAIANAAVFGPVGDIESNDLQQWIETLAIDVGGVAAVAHAVIPTMRAQGSGRVLTMSGGGVGGPRPLSRASAYVASKAAVGALVEVLAAELVGTEVTINAVAPGAVPTGFMSAALEAGEEQAGAALYAAAADETPADLSRLRSLLTFLTSPESGWLNGRVLSANWDSPEALTAKRDAIEAGSLLRLRRIDADLYAEIERTTP